MKKFKLINIIGIDGAGKTTLAKSLTDDLKITDKSVHYRYCQYFAKILYPIKLFAKLSIMRKADEFGDYNRYNRTKKATSNRFPLLANIYAFTWLIDYIFQVFFKVTVPVFFGQKLIIDRYIFDIAVNLSITTNNEIVYAVKLIRFFLIFAPKPDLTVFIDLAEEIALSRKDDIQDIEYLRERRKRYLSLAKAYGFIVIDGAKSQEQVLYDAKRILGIDGQR